LFLCSVLFSAFSEAVGIGERVLSDQGKLAASDGSSSHCGSADPVVQSFEIKGRDV